MPTSKTSRKPLKTPQNNIKTTLNPESKINEIKINTGESFLKKLIQNNKKTLLFDLDNEKNE